MDEDIFEILEYSFPDGIKMTIAGSQYFRCKNMPESNLYRLSDFKCPRWINNNGIFDERGYKINHIKERILGGSDDINNLQALCIDCHKYKTKDFVQSIELKQVKQSKHMMKIQNTQTQVEILKYHRKNRTMHEYIIALLIDSYKENINEPTILCINIDKVSYDRMMSFLVNYECHCIKLDVGKKKHLKKVEEKEREEKANSETFSCSDCGQEYKHATSLSRHKKNGCNKKKASDNNEFIKTLVDGILKEKEEKEQLYNQIIKEKDKTIEEKDKTIEKKDKTIEETKNELKYIHKQYENTNNFIQQSFSFIITHIVPPEIATGEEPYTIIYDDSENSDSDDDFENNDSYDDRSNDNNSDEDESDANNDTAIDNEDDDAVKTITIRFKDLAYHYEKKLYATILLKK
ncbi:MAG: hypothetical protein Edafosvirus2_71 [Edafosvirus sp.]|uniref:C2H2-type domain-containing protein n=1 Tax=Edafosvirus sp. TaxID=2487765 RepID=A0A3G4ZSK1_9VIRU|nr:MAG: hypothetical protein Edafosvirus2_71 [Edafosvirus sp.]